MDYLYFFNCNHEDELIPGSVIQQEDETGYETEEIDAYESGYETEEECEYIDVEKRIRFLIGEIIKEVNSPGIYTKRQLIESVRQKLNNQMENVIQDMVFYKDLTPVRTTRQNEYYQLK